MKTRRARRPVTARMSLDFATPSNPVPYDRGRQLLRAVVVGLEIKYGGGR